MKNRINKVKRQTGRVLQKFLVLSKGHKILAGLVLMLVLGILAGGILWADHNANIRAHELAKQQENARLADVEHFSDVKAANNESEAIPTQDNPSNGSEPGAAPFDSRSTANLRPSPDKPPIPKNQKPLSISPSSVTIYKNLNGAKNIKNDITETVVQVSAGDGRALYYPASTGPLLLTATAFNPRPSWGMTVSSSYAAAGATYDIPISAVAVDGSASYVGSLHVTVKALPSFTASTDWLYGLSGANSLNHYFEDLAYSDSFGGTYAPNLTLSSGAGITCVILEYSAKDIRCSSLSLLNPGVHQLYFNLENQFQKFTIKTQLNVLPY